MEKQNVVKARVNELLGNASMTNTELKEYLIDEAEYDASYVEDLSSYELFDHYLRYIGIIGFTDDIISGLLAAYKLENTELA